MKRILLLAVVAVASFAAACGGGSNVNPPPPMGNFTTASLKGQYQFYMSGTDFNGGRIARVGSFVADGAGNITGGLEDVFSQSNGGYSLVTFTGGTYAVSANGYSVLTLLNSGGGLGLSIVLQSTTAGTMIQNDLNATSSGVFNLAGTQTAVSANFTLSEIANNYVFDVSGISQGNNGAAGYSLIGQFQTNGGTIAGGTVDINDGNGLVGVSPSGPVAVSAGTAYQLDANNGNGANFGRGTMTLTFGANTYTFVFYIVNGTQLDIMEEDSAFNAVGAATQQSGTIPTTSSAFLGSFAYLIGGSSTVGPLAYAGRLTADGSGNVTNVALDLNDAGTIGSISSGSTVTLASYTIDGAHPGSGRGTMTFTDSALGTFNFVFYLSSPQAGVIQETTSGILADGVLQAQNGGAVAATNATDFAFTLSGQNQAFNNNNTPFEEDFVGQYVLPTPSGQTFNGAVDIAELGSNGKNFFQQNPITVTETVTGDGTQGNTFKIVTGQAPTVTLNLKGYAVNANTFFVVDVDTQRVDAGTINPQQ